MAWKVHPTAVGSAIASEGAAAAPVQQGMVPPALQGEESAPEQQSMDEPAKPGPKCATDEEATVWAQEWWQQYEVKVEPVDAATYNTVHGLMKLLATPDELSLSPVKLLRLSWLLKRAGALSKAKTDDERRKLALPRRQVLERDHPEAFMDLAEVRSLHTKLQHEVCCFGVGGPDEFILVIAISHGWLTRDHPDPLGQQLQAFAKLVRGERRACPPCGACVARLMNPWWLCECFASNACACLDCQYCYYGQQRGTGCSNFCEHSSRMPAGEFAVFYDYCSLLQKDERGNRTKAEQAAFKAALGGMGAWYGHKMTTTAVMSRMPEGWPTAAPYHARGWTAFEHSVSNMTKPHRPQTFRRIADLGIPRGNFFIADCNAGSWSSNKADAPLHPKAFAALLARRTFTNGADCEVVADLYADTLAGAIGGARELSFQACDWGDKEMEKFAAVLPLARSATALDLSSNLRVGERGAVALAAALEAGAAERLRTLNVTCTSSRWSEAAKERLRAACGARGIIATVGDEDTGG